MHAFLIIGNNSNLITNEIENIRQKTNSKRLLNFALNKIEDCRNLNNFLKLKINEISIIQIDNIDEATNEAANAFLKNLEEPQDNIYFVLTAKNTKSVLPTIVSRCQIVKSISQDHEISDAGKINSFLNASSKEKIQIIESVKERSDAINFISDLIYYDHSRNNYRYQKYYLDTLKNLRLNGNVALQLTNLVVRMDNEHGQ